MTRRHGLGVAVEDRCESCGAHLDPLRTRHGYHTCPSPRRGWWWCVACKAWRYANPSSLARNEPPSCWRCAGPLTTALEGKLP